MRRAITWTNAEPVHWRIYAALGGNVHVPYYCLLPLKYCNIQWARQTYLFWSNMITDGCLHFSLYYVHLDVPCCVKLPQHQINTDSITCLWNVLCAFILAPIFFMWPLDFLCALWTPWNSLYSVKLIVSPTMDMVCLSVYVTSNHSHPTTWKLYLQ